MINGLKKYQARKLASMQCLFCNVVKGHQQGGEAQLVLE